MAQCNILLLVAVYLTLTGTADLQRTNCKDSDRDGAACSRDNDFPSYDPEDVTDRIETWIYIAIGITAAFIISIPVCIACCLLCSFCPAYKYRHKRGAVYGATTIQQQPMTVYPQSAYPHQPNFQPPPQQSMYPGFVYSPGQMHSAPQPQAPNNPYYNTIPEYKPHLQAGNSAGTPAEEPPQYENAPEYQKTSAL